MLFFSDGVVNRGVLSGKMASDLAGLEGGEEQSE